VRRPDEGSLATTVRTPRALSSVTTARPTGPQPTTIATSLRPTSPRLTACQPTAIGSVRTATSSGSPFGTRRVSDSCTSIRSAKAPGARADSPVGCTSAPWRSSGSETTGVPTGRCPLVPGPRSTTSATNSWPSTISSSERIRSW
jgi:hypothetical protein